MQKSAKKIALLLVMALLLNILLPGMALAIESDPTFTVGTAQGRQGDTGISIPIQVSNNPGISSIKLTVAFDTQRLELTGASINNAWIGSPTQSPSYESPYILIWVNGTAEYTVANSTFATLTFSIKDDAPSGAANITVTYDADDVYNLAYDNVNFAVENGSIMVLKTPINTATAQIYAPTRGASLSSAVFCNEACTGAVEWYKGTAATGEPVSGIAAPDAIYTAKITLTPADGESFADSVSVSINGDAAETVTPVNGTVTIIKTFSKTASKPTPVCIAPSGLTAIYGQTLADVSLDNPEGNTEGTWAWKNNSALVGDVGTNTFKATFTPSDTQNFATVENIDVIVSVAPKTVASATVTASPDSYTYTGSAIIPTKVEVKDGTTVIPASEYTLGYSGNTAVGDATITVTDKEGGNYIVSGTGSFSITQATGSVTVSGSLNKTYDGTAVDPTGLTVNSKSTGAKTYKYYTNAACTTGETTTAPINAGNYWLKVTVAADANVAEATSAPLAFTISPKSIEGATVTLGTDPTFSGTEQAISIISVVLDSKTLTSSDYEVASGGKGTNAGSYTLTIAGKGNYSSTATKGWSIAAASVSGTPTIDNTAPKFGETLTVSTSGMIPATGYTYQWKAGNAAISGATNSTYVLTADEMNKAITVEVTCTDPNYTGSATSDATAAVDKADAPIGKKASYSVYFGDTDPKTVAVADFGLPGDIVNAALSNATSKTGDDILSADPTATGFSLKSGLTSSDKEKKASWTVTITSDNYGDITATVEVTVVDMVVNWTDVDTLFPAGKTVTYGVKESEVATLPTSGTATINGVSKNGTFSYVNGANVPNAGESVTIQVKFTLTEDVGKTATKNYTIKVLKATPAVTTPTAKALTYTGELQALVNAGSTTGGELQYSPDNTTYAPTIPEGTEAKDYTVYYKVVGDANYNDVEAKTVTATIKKATPDGSVVLKSDAPTLYNSNTIAELIAQLEWNGVKPAAANDDSIELTETALTVGTTDYHWTYTSANTNYDPKSGTVSVAVLKNDLTALEVTGTPTKTEYEYGDAFDPTGLTVQAVYANGDKKPVSAADGVTFNSGEALTAVGDTVAVTVSYTDSGITKTASVSVKVTKKALDVSGMSWTGSTPFTFDGTEKSMILSGTLPQGVTVTDKTDDKATDAGDYTASATFALADGYSSDNYQITGTNPLTAAWSISKAAGGSETMSVPVKYDNSAAQTVSLAPFIPSNAGEIGEITVAETADADDIIASVSGDMTAKTATFTPTDSLDGEKVGKAATLTATISTKNYTDISVTITVTLTDKDVPTVAAQDITKTYDGNAVEASAIQGTATFNGAAVAGAWAFQGTPDVTDVAHSGVKAVVFTPTDAATYEAVETTVTVTINKATPTGTLSFPSVSASGKTLADVKAEGAMDDVFKGVDSAALAGTFAWDLDADTQVVQGTAYAWTFTPGDANYNNVTGSTTPWPIPTYSGGSGGSSTPAVTVPVSGDSGSVKVTATVSGSTATVGNIKTSDLNKIVDTATAPVDVVVDLSGLGKAIDKAKIPNSTFKNVTEAAKQDGNGIIGLEVKLTTATVTMDGTTLNAVLEQAGSAPVIVAVEPTKTSSLNSKQRDTVKELTAPNVIDAYFQSGSKRISSFAGGRVQITVPYVLETGKLISVSYVEDNGTLTPVAATYNTDNETVSFYPPHFSYYVISSDGVGPCDGGENCPAHAFADVDATQWYHEAVDYAITNGLMAGYGNGKFAPTNHLSRAMLCQILYNKESGPAVIAKSLFTDVPADKWYTDAVIWAYENKFVDGYGEGKFGPDDPITREQLAAILWRYDGSPAIDRMDSLAQFADRNKVSGYAETAMQWAVKQSIISGKGSGILDPLGTATRAEVAAMIMRYLELK